MFFNLFSKLRCSPQLFLRYLNWITGNKMKLIIISVNRFIHQDLAGKRAQLNQIFTWRHQCTKNFVFTVNQQWSTPLWLIMILSTKLILKFFCLSKCWAAQHKKLASVENFLQCFIDIIFLKAESQTELRIIIRSILHNANRKFA